MKLKKGLLLIGLSILGIGAIATTSALSLTSCSTTSNPYGPYTNINVAVTNTNTTNPNIKPNSNITFNYQTNSNNVNIVENNKNITLQELANRIYEIKDTNGKSLEVKPDMTTAYGPDLFNQYCTAVQNYNNANLAVQIYSNLSNFTSSFVNILLKAQPYNNPSNATTNINVSEWFTKQTSNLSKEFAFANVFSVGEGSGMYSLWPKTIDLAFNVTKEYQTPGTNAYSSTDDPNPNYINVEVTKFDIHYSWYKHEHVGGTYIDNLDTINNALTSSQKDLLSKKYGIQKFSSLDYTMSLLSPTSAFKPVFNFAPNIVDYKQNNSTTRLYSGQGSVVANAIKDPNNNKQWIIDPKQTSYNIFGLNNSQTFNLFNNIKDFFVNSVTNNKNKLSYNLYSIIWSIGYYKLNPAQNSLDQNVYKTEVSNNESWLSNENNFNNIKNPTWQKLSTNQNYAKGIETIYNWFKI